MKTYLRFLKFLKPHTLVFIAALLCMVISSVLSGLSLGIIVPIADNILGSKNIHVPQGLPGFLKDFVTYVNSMPRGELLNRIAVLLAIIFFLKGLFLFLQTYLINDVSLRITRDVRDRLYEKYISFSLDFYSRSHTGKLVSRVIYDTGILQGALTEGLTDFIFQSIQLLVYLVIVMGVMTYYSIPWTVVFISLFLWPIVAYLVVRVGRRVRALGKAVQEKVGELSTTIHESISGIRILKAFSMEPKELEKFNRENREVYRISMKSIKRTEMVGPLVEFIGIACAVLVLWFGGRGIVLGEIDAGAFLVFLGALLSMLKPFKKLSRIHLINQQASSVMVRMFEILDKEPTVTEKKDAGRLPLISKSLSFNNVKFRYDTDDILEDINLEVRPGDVIAIVGHTGAGKTTLLNLLPRFYDPTEGSIMIDGHDIKDGTLKSLRDQIGIVTQEPILFHDTVLANVSYGKPDASQDEVIDACKAAYCHNFIVQMENGYDTYIGERGVRLSGGEKQRLAIARAILKNPPILILDEATSQLDSESEKLVQDAIDKLMHGRTVFIIAHRLSTIRNATRIVVLAKGRINGTGTHEELLENNELYRRLYEGGKH